MAANMRGMRGWSCGWRGLEGFTKDLEIPVTCLALTSEAPESSKSRLNPSLVKS